MKAFSIPRRELYRSSQFLIHHHQYRADIHRLFTGRRHHGSSTASPEELSHFSRLADSWWDSEGPQRILHKMNLSRMDYIRDTLSQYGPGDLPGYSIDLLTDSMKQKYQNRTVETSMGNFQDYKVLDVGCGGGLLAESLARLKEVKQVRGIDLTADVLDVAKEHMKKDPKLAGKLDYRLIGIDQVPENEQYDIVTIFEMLEHVPRPSEVLEAAFKHIKPGGWLFISTINRTPIAYFTTIFMGEDVLGIVPKGTHSYDKYINEQELREWFSIKKDWDVVRSDGCIFIPGFGWKFTKQRGIGNYFFVARRRI